MISVHLPELEYHLHIQSLGKFVIFYDITGLLDAPELMISQGFRLLKSVASGKINWVEITL